MKCLFSTVPSRSLVAQGEGCFYPASVISGDDAAPLELFNKMLHGLLEEGWVRGCEVEACRNEYQCFAQQKRQLERSSTRSRPDVGNVLLFRSSQNVSVLPSICLKYVS